MTKYVWGLFRLQYRSHGPYIVNGRRKGNGRLYVHSTPKCRGVLLQTRKPKLGEFGWILCPCGECKYDVRKIAEVA